MYHERYDWRFAAALQPRGLVEFQDRRRGLMFRGPLKSLELDETEFVLLRLKWILQRPLTEHSGPDGWRPGPEELRELKFPNLSAGFTVEGSDLGKRLSFCLHRGLQTLQGLVYVEPVEGLTGTTSRVVEAQSIAVP